MNEGAEFAGADGEMTRAGALFTVQGATTAKTARVRDGEIVGIGKAEGVQAGYLLGIGGRSRARRIVTEMPATNAALAIVTRDRKDDVRLSMALNKLTEENPALRGGQDELLHEPLLKGVNDEHLAVTLDRLKQRYGRGVDSRQPGVASRDSGWMRFG